jgi:hypothetical protein
MAYEIYEGFKKKKGSGRERNFLLRPPPIKPDRRSAGGPPEARVTSFSLGTPVAWPPLVDTAPLAPGGTLGVNWLMGSKLALEFSVQVKQTVIKYLEYNPL